MWYEKQNEDISITALHCGINRFIFYFEWMSELFEDLTDQ